MRSGYPRDLWCRDGYIGNHSKLSQLYSYSAFFQDDACGPDVDICWYDPQQLFQVDEQLNSSETKSFTRASPSVVHAEFLAVFLRDVRLSSQARPRTGRCQYGDLLVRIFRSQQLGAPDCWYRKSNQWTNPVFHLLQELFVQHSYHVVVFLSVYKTQKVLDREKLTESMI